ncbi:hypothetical protein L9F63_004617, partial [Diploptera punctata]
SCLFMYFLPTCIAAPASMFFISSQLNSDKLFALKSRNLLDVPTLTPLMSSSSKCVPLLWSPEWLCSGLTGTTRTSSFCLIPLTIIVNVVLHPFTVMQLPPYVFENHAYLMFSLINPVSSLTKSSLWNADPYHIYGDNITDFFFRRGYRLILFARFLQYRRPIILVLQYLFLIIEVKNAFKLLGLQLSVCLTCYSLTRILLFLSLLSLGGLPPFLGYCKLKILQHLT